MGRQGMAMVTPKRFDIYLVSLDPTIGTEIKKTRPCLIISPNEINRHLQTIIVAPMTSRIRTYPFRVNLVFQKKRGQIVLDQIRTIDKKRLVKKLGKIPTKKANQTLSVIQEMFAK